MATFVPTDVDARIRHHAFVELDEPALSVACELVDEAARWDVRLVSARVVAISRGIAVSGSRCARARSGGRSRSARGRLVDRLREAIDEELAHEHAVLRELARGDELDLPPRGDDDRPQYGRSLARRGGVARRARASPNYVYDTRASVTRRRPRSATCSTRAGAMNKAEMADENHRFLALRKARGLRRSRDLLLPIGPFFDAWGETVATHPALEHEDRAEVVTALLAVHDHRATERGCLRALAAIDERTPGGLRSFADDLPARLRKLLSTGPIREALKTPRTTFEARLRKRAQTHFPR